MFEKSKHNPVLWRSIACICVLIWCRCFKVAGEGLSGTPARLLARAAGRGTTGGGTGGGVCPNAAGMSPAWIPWGLGCSGPGWSLVGLVWSMMKLLILYLVGIIPVLQLFVQFRAVILIGKLVAWGVRGAGGGLGLLGDVGICCGTQLLVWRRVGIVSFTLGLRVP